mgnify:CR=1 FL=1
MMMRLKVFFELIVEEPTHYLKYYIGFFEVRGIEEGNFPEKYQELQ